MEVTAPVLLFFESCALGFLLGALYDAFRILRISFPNGRILVFLEDVLYFASVTVASFTFIVVQSSGVLRAFLILGELLGAILYFFSLSILVMNAAHLIIRFIKALLRFLYRVTLRPVIRLCCWIGRMLKRLALSCAHRCKKIAVKFSRKRKKHLKHKAKIVYNDGKQSNGSEQNGKSQNGKAKKNKKARHT